MREIFQKANEKNYQNKPLEGLFSTDLKLKSDKKERDIMTSNFTSTDRAFRALVNAEKHFDVILDTQRQQSSDSDKFFSRQH